MRRSFFLVVSTLLFGVGSPAATAQSATQGVTIVVEEINDLSFSTDVQRVARPFAGRSTPEVATENAGTYAFTTNGYGKKITGELEAGRSAGLSLDVSLAAPTASGSSVGIRTLDGASSVDLVTGISRVAQRGLDINYAVSAEADGPPITGTGETQTVTFTVTDR